MSVEESSQALQAEIKLFYSERRRIKSLLSETDDLLNKDFAQFLSPELVAAINQNLELQSVKDRVGQLFRGADEMDGVAKTTGNQQRQRPCIVIVGQTKSGKSTFINELLGDRFVCQNSTPCTARVTRLTYSERVFIRVVDTRGQQIGDTVYPEKNFIDENLTKLSGSDREDESLLSSLVEAGVPSEFLKHGIDVIDSPGLNENSALDALTMKTIDSFLPIILYVIDGHYGVTLAAEKDIESIRASAPGAELFYLVTKMDVATEDVPDPSSGHTVEHIEEERARRVFDKLQRMGCVPRDETPATCRSFFCISSRAMTQYRRCAKRAALKAASASAAATAAAATASAENKWVQRFAQVQFRVAEFAGQQFRNLIVDAGSSLLALHTRIMSAVMDKANDIKASAMLRRKNLELIRAMECRNHEQTKKIVDSHWGNFHLEAEKFLQVQGPILLEDVKSLQYSNHIMQLSGSSPLSPSQIMQRCIEEIHQFINCRVVNAYQNFLTQGAMGACFKDLEDLKERVSDYEKEIEQTPCLSVLKASLIDDCSLSPGQIYSSGFLSVMRQMSLSLRTAFCHPGVIFNREVGDPMWKRYQASSHLQNINTNKLVDNLVASMHNWLDRRHFQFLQKILCSEQLVENAASLSEVERQRIVQLSPKLTFMYTRGLEIVTGYRYRGYRSERDSVLGTGAQGYVCSVRDPIGRISLAAKRVTVDAENLANISHEVFYSSVLQHPNLAHVKGVRLIEHHDNPCETTWTIELYMELLHSDVWNLMQHRQLSMKNRIWLGLQLAKALEFLHKSDLIHRDVKLQNLLVDKDLKQVKLTDFGLTKSTGLTGQSLVGTPIYLAPEMVTNSSYDTSADIYSLGIALWYLA